jgi:hypothetical protein
MTPSHGSLKKKMSKIGSIVGNSPDLPTTPNKIGKKSAIRIRDTSATRSGSLVPLTAKHRRNSSEGYMQTAVAQLIPKASNSGNYSDAEYFRKNSSIGNRQSTKNISHELPPINRRLSDSVDYSVSQARERLFPEINEGKKSRFEKYKPQHAVPDEIYDPTNGIYNSRGFAPRDNDLASSKVDQVRNSRFGGAKYEVQRLLAPVLMGLEDLIEFSIHSLPITPTSMNDSQILNGFGGSI